MTRVSCPHAPAGRWARRRHPHPTGRLYRYDPTARKIVAIPGALWCDLERAIVVPADITTIRSQSPRRASSTRLTRAVQTSIGSRLHGGVLFVWPGKDIEAAVTIVRSPAEVARLAPILVSRLRTETSSDPFALRVSRALNAVEMST